MILDNHPAPDNRQDIWGDPITALPRPDPPRLSSSIGYIGRMFEGWPCQEIRRFPPS
ncbi:hypothetical protein FMEAI12_6500037 [Parafrankia sp. Ea1.12]|nr:hypothetical protein FMEAI12_6500037 [Parafrankia sp. Ea1.12]